MLEKVQRRATQLMSRDKSWSYDERLQKSGLTTLETRRLQPLACAAVLQPVPISCHFRDYKVPLSCIVSGAISSELSLPFISFSSCRMKQLVALISCTLLLEHDSAVITQFSLNMIDCSAHCSVLKWIQSEYFMQLLQFIYLFSGKVFCAVCHKACKGQAIRLNDKYLHVDCFKCFGEHGADCSIRLALIY